MRTINMNFNLQRLARWTIWLMVAWAIIAVALAAGAIWQQTQTTTLDLSVGALLPVLALTSGSYLLRCLRWHLLVRRVVPDIPFKLSFRHFLMGFGLSITPGKAGEVFKLYRLQKDSGTPVARSLPAMAVEKMSEAFAFGLIALLSGLMIPELRAHAATYRWPLIALVVLACIALALRPLLVRFIKARASESNAWWKRSSQQLAAGGALMLGPKPVLMGTGIGFLGRCLDGLALFYLAQHFGVMLPVFAGLFILGTSGLTGGLSMLPGGLGAVEVNQAGLLLLWGSTAPEALMITLILRLFTLWLWIGIGIMAVLLTGQLQSEQSEREMR